MNETANKKAIEKAEKDKKTTAALGVPTGVATMLSTAQALIGTKYTSGGGHDGWDPIAALKKIGVDCSGFVSQVLHSGGVSLSSPLTTEGLPGQLQKGAGKYVTVFDRANAGSNSHTLIDILGKYFESGGNSQYNPKGGVSLLTAAQAKGELSSGGFEAYHPAQLNAAVKGGLTEATLKTGLAGPEAVAAALEKSVKTLETNAKKMLGETTPRGNLESAIQSGTAPTLEKVLGVSTSGKTGTALQGLLSEPWTQGKLEHHIMPTLEKSAAGTATGKQYDQMIAQLQAAGMTTLVSRLTQAHKQALADLGRELYSAEKEKDAQLLQNQATEEKDRTTEATNTAAKQLQIVKDETQQQTDAMQAAAKQIEDATRVDQGQLLRDGRRRPGRRSGDGRCDVGRSPANPGPDGHQSRRTRRARQVRPGTRRSEA